MVEAERRMARRRRQAPRHAARIGAGAAESRRTHAAARGAPSRVRLRLRLRSCTATAAPSAAPPLCAADDAPDDDFRHRQPSVATPNPDDERGGPLNPGVFGKRHADLSASAHSCTVLQSRARCGSACCGASLRLCAALSTVPPSVLRAGIEPATRGFSVRCSTC